MLNFIINLFNGEYGLFSTVLAVLVATVLLGVVLALVGSAIQLLAMNTKGGRKVKASQPKEKIYVFDVYTPMGNWKGHAKRRCSIRIAAYSFEEAEAKAEEWVYCENGFVECTDIIYK